MLSALVRIVAKMTPEHRLIYFKARHPTLVLGKSAEGMALAAGEGWPWHCVNPERGLPCRLGFPRVPVCNRESQRLRNIDSVAFTF